MSKDDILDKLRAALALVETVKQDNECYCENFEQLKEAYATLQTKSEEAAKEYKVALKEKEIAEQRHHQIIAVLKQLVDQRDTEMDHIRAKMESTSTRAMPEIKEIHIAKLEEVKQWEARFLTLQQSLDAESDTERLRIVQREKVELELKTTMLLSELDEVSNILVMDSRVQILQIANIYTNVIQCNLNKLGEKEQLRLEYEQNLRSHKRQLAEQLGEAKVLQTEKDSLQANVASLEQDVNISDMKMTVLKERTENQNVVGDLKDKIVELKSSIKTLNSTIQDMSHKICHSEKEHMENAD
ncbi:hypothetical protein BSLG_005657 [Batrachochytrium salamandrivorans]|nr:hypothetical protein BSLG_005657 [Batrachochytrium salamandrivorans]